ncbi:DNA mismatch repair protein MutS [Paenibacillus psychroresistens]|uniref:DNA mismatch repair protein MutS n=1 Tax=Paenibacillus psychroresistens TaxID=1778678 RepID=A0A6B8RJY2_9BACL|nr:DNA mismatch repair protein MutS [Paenibacillus psychroresistens]QGQ96721.1 DNA mismatch repair protein MutS [Paenibacillus psychroresistens]
MIKYTPMIEQYLLVKAEVPDAFLFFRLGDFYEMFFDDAILASKELEITLTGRDGGTQEKIPMCGIPYHAAENYIARLIEKGYKVAICEQVEKPEEAKGIVRREIVRIVTPGTLMEGKMLSDSVNNYIAAAIAHDDKYGFAVCDLSTGELHVTSVELSLELLLDEFTAFAPSEMLGAADLVEQVRANLLLTSKAVVFTQWDSVDEQFTRQHFAAEHIKPLDPACLYALTLLMNYLSATQKRMLSHITHIRQYESNQFMMMDSFTRRNLELVETVRERSKKGSLLWLLDESVTSMGGRMLRRWIEKPLMQVAQIDQRLEAVDCFYRQLIIRDDIRHHLQQIYDLERLTARISYGSANGRDLLALQLSLAAIPALRQICLDSDSNTLQQLAKRMDLCEDVLSWISAAIVDEPPVSIRDGGIIRDGYHEHLDQLKEADRNGKQWMAELERQEREKTGIKSLKIGYNRIFGYYIEITRSHLVNLPEGTYERKQTLANAERFVTPELKEKEALILEAQEKMVDIEQELFIKLREQIAQQISRLQQLAEIVAEVDVYQSLATVSAANRFKRPYLTDGYSFQVGQGRHPVVETVMKSGSFVANDTHLSEEDGIVLLITGPNMAGKSTYMRQVAIIAIMAQIGCFVPAEHANVSLIDRIFTRIGAADDLIAGQSTFMVEMMDIQVMTEKATKRSLVIIDELGRGTSTGEGMAIAQAVIEFMHDEIGCKTLVSTHFHELAHLEETLSSLRNYCMAVRESNQQVTFLRKLIPGAADTSYGIYCARIAGLPESIIQRSYTLLNGFIARESIAPYETQQVAAAAEPFVQLSLFAEADKPQADKAKKKLDPKTEQVIDELRNADIINMTPLQAMNLVYELKKKLAEK